jgi:hypothetical protein
MTRGYGPAWIKWPLYMEVVFATFFCLHDPYGYSFRKYSPCYNIVHIGFCENQNVLILIKFIEKTIYFYIPNIYTLLKLSILYGKSNAIDVDNFWTLLHSGACWKYFSSERSGSRPRKL